MKAVESVAEILKREGVEYLFCFPNNPLIDAAARVGIRPILTRTERTLVNMADGYTRVHNARKTGVCCVQAGPGIENAFGGVAQSAADGTPILMLPGQASRDRLGIPSSFATLEAYRPVTKWAEQINQSTRVPELMRRAFSLLRTPPFKPVLLELPGDVAAEDVAELDYAPARAMRSAGDPAAVRDAVRLLLAAKKPLIVAGHGVLYAEATAELRELAELLQAPVMTTMAGKSAFPENHPLSVGAAGNTGAGGAQHFLKESDLVLGIGCSFTRGSFHANYPAGKTLVQVTANPADVDVDYRIDCAVLGDAQLVLRQLVEESSSQLGADGRRGDQAAAREVKRAKDTWIDGWLPKLTSNETPINPFRVIWDLNEALDRTNTIATHDSGNPRDQMLPFYEALVPRGYLGWGKSTQLGFGLGLALGAKLAAPDKTVVNVMGDAAFGMAGLDIETAARSQIGSLTIILNNGALGGYEKALPYATEKYGTKFLSGDYVKVAEGLGAWSERVEQPGEIIPAVRRAEEVTRGGRPAVLEIRTREDTSYVENRTR
jgi:thiamine pyrophosphate-dependent acetolactate synthase large subunit-like protein